MKICITAQGKDLTAPLDVRFGRCAYFLIVDLDSKAVEALENSNAESGGGAGIQSAQLVAGKGVSVVLTGNIGPNAFKVLDAAGIKVFPCPDGTASDALEAYQAGTLKPVSSPTVNPQH